MSGLRGPRVEICVIKGTDNAEIDLHIRRSSSVVPASCYVCASVTIHPHLITAEPPLGGEGEAWPVEGKREPERKGLSGARTNEDCSTLEGKKFLGVPGPIEAAPIGGLAGEKAWPVGGDDVETGPSMPCLLGEKGPERKVLSGARSNEDFSTVEGNKFPGVLGPIEAVSIGGLAGEKAWPVGGDDVERGPCMPCQLGENEPAAPETQE